MPRKTARGRLIQARPVRVRLFAVLAGLAATVAVLPTSQADAQSDPTSTPAAAQPPAGGDLEGLETDPGVPVEGTLANSTNELPSRVPTTLQSSAKASECSPVVGTDTDVVCIKPIPDAEAKASHQAAADPSDFSTAAIRIPPQFCFETQFTGWQTNRREACRTTPWRGEVFRGAEIIGTFDFNVGEYLYTQPAALSSGRHWAHQISVDIIRGQGDIAFLSVSGSAVCNGGCSLLTSDFPLSPAVPQGAIVNGESYFATTATASGAIGIANSGWTLTWEKLFALPGISPVGNSPGLRCDNALPTAGPGCIFPNVTPAITYSLSGTVSELALHLAFAQGSGLPGAYPNGVPLNRITDSTIIAANRAKACPSSYPRPSGKSCDEYPFASTLQGAATGGGTARTFPGCSITLTGPPSTGINGYSVCMINATQNTTGGSQLSGMYTANRVLNGDPFRVAIVG